MERWGLYELIYDRIMGGAVPLRSVDIDLLKNYEITGVVDLTTIDSPVRDLYRENDIDYIKIEIPDLSDTDMDTVFDFIRFFNEHEKIYVHCEVGEGRTGMMLACLFVYEFQMAPSDAIKLVRARRHLSIHTDRQIEMIYRFAEYTGYDVRYNFDMTRPPPMQERSTSDLSVIDFEDRSGVNPISITAPDIDSKLLNEILSPLSMMISYQWYEVKMSLISVSLEDANKLRNIFRMNMDQDFKYRISMDYIESNQPETRKHLELDARLTSIRYFQKSRLRDLREGEKYEHIKFKHLDHPKYVYEDKIDMRIIFEASEKTKIRSYSKWKEELLERIQNRD